MHRPFEVLEKVTGGKLKEVALHSGKYRGDDLGEVIKARSLKLVTPCQVYYGSCVV